MEVNLNDIKPNTTDSKMLRQNVKEENSNCTKTTTTTVSKTEFTINDNDDSALLASLPKAEVKIRKLDEAKLLMDNNENSLSVDTLIEILSSNDTNNKLPSSHNNKSESDIGPPLSAPSTLSSPSSSSSSTSSKAGRLSESFVSPGPSPKSTPNKFPSPYHLNGGKPMISDMNKKMKQVSKRQPRAVYQSQISNNSIGIKICIKKSVNANKTTSMPSPNNNKTPKKRSRKSKAKTHESDSDDAYVKRRKKSSSVSSNNTKTPSDEPVEQSGWGKHMPKEILFDVSSSKSRFRCCVNSLFFCFF